MDYDIVPGTIYPGDLFIVNGIEGVYEASWIPLAHPVTVTSKCGLVVADEMHCKKVIKKKTMTHSLKTWPEYFNEVVIGNKTFEIRKYDRDFKVGDHLLLKEYDPFSEDIDFGFTPGYSGRTVLCKVTYILKNYSAVKAGYVVMGIKLLGDSNL